MGNVVELKLVEVGENFRHRRRTDSPQSKRAFDLRPSPTFAPSVLPELIETFSALSDDEIEPAAVRVLSGLARVDDFLSREQMPAHAQSPTVSPTVKG